MFIVGIDIAKRSHEAVMIDLKGNTIGKPLRFANSQSGYLRLMDFLRTHAGNNAEFEFGMANGC